MKHALGPLYAEISYTSNGHGHKAIVSLPWETELAPTSGVDPSILDRGGVEVLASVALQALVTAVLPLFSTTAVFNGYDIKFARSVVLGPLWIFSGSFASGTGTSPGQTVAAGQLSIMMRTSKGNGARLVLMETTMGVDVVFPGGSMAANPTFAPLAALVAGDTIAFVGRDGGYPIVISRAITKENDVWRGRLKIN